MQTSVYIYNLLIINKLKFRSQNVLKIKFVYKSDTFNCRNINILFFSLLTRFHRGYLATRFCCLAR